MLTTNVCSYAGQHFREVWSWEPDSGDWTLLADDPNGPSSRRNHTAVYDSINDRMLVFGGITGNHETANGNYWSFNPSDNSWAPYVPTSETSFIPTLTNSEMLFDAARHRAILCATGGLLWNLDVDSDYVTSAPYSQWPTTSRLWAVYAFDSARERVVAYGGSGSPTPYEQLWVYDYRSTSTVTRWFQVPKTGVWPGPKWLTRAVIDPNRDRMIMYGGNRFQNFSGGEYSDVTYELNLETYEWTTATVTTPPSRRGQFGACWDPLRSREHIFGGLFRTTALDIMTFRETWSYNSANGDWNLALPHGLLPRSRRMCTTVYDTLRNRVIMFGGEEFTTSPLLAAASIKLPRNGTSIHGNRALIMAEITTGTPEQVQSVRFQYRTSTTNYDDEPVTAGEWLDIPTADPNQHPNPDSSAPWFVHWDLSSYGALRIDLRAIVTDMLGNTDPAPAEVTVNIDPNAPETSGTLATVETESVRSARVDRDVDSGAGARGSEANVVVRIPAQSLTSAADLHIRCLSQATSDSSNLSGWFGYGFEVALSSAQSLLQATKLGTMICDYPDTDQDGIVDGTSFSETSLHLYRINGTTPIALTGNQVDALHNSVSGLFDQTGTFVLLAEVPAAPVIAVTPATIQFQPPATAQLIVRNAGGGTLQYTIQGDSRLAITPSPQDLAADETLTHTISLAPGQAAGFVTTATVVSAGSQNASVSVPVTVLAASTGGGGGGGSGTIVNTPVSSMPPTEAGTAPVEAISTATSTSLPDETPGSNPADGLTATWKKVRLRPNGKLSAQLSVTGNNAALPTVRVLLSADESPSTDDVEIATLAGKSTRRSHQTLVLKPTSISTSSLPANILAIVGHTEDPGGITFLATAPVPPPRR